MPFHRPPVRPRRGAYFYCPLAVVGDHNRFPSATGVVILNELVPVLLIFVHHIEHSVFQAVGVVKLGIFEILDVSDRVESLQSGFRAGSVCYYFFLRYACRYSKASLHLSKTGCKAVWGVFCEVKTRKFNAQKSEKPLVIQGFSKSPIRTLAPKYGKHRWCFPFFDTPGGTRKGGGSVSCRKNSPVDCF